MTGEMVRPEGFEPPTLWFEAKCSIQLSYGRGVLLSQSVRQAECYAQTLRRELCRFARRRRSPGGMATAWREC